MSILRKVKAVERLFDALDRDISAFKAESGLHCPSGCGKCCTKANIEANPLEFLPFAFHCFQDGSIYDRYEQLKGMDNPEICMNIRTMMSGADNGFCSQYKHRGLICRLFGFSARRNKYGEPNIIACGIIKDQLAEKQGLGYQLVDNSLPYSTYYYSRLAAIDSRLSQEVMPINQAIKRAFEEVMSYYAYRRPPKKVV